MKNNDVLTEHEIIYKYLSKLNFNKKECFEFKNDGALLKHVSGKELVVTNDSISENIDFFVHDSPESIAQKIVIYNLSDLSAMGAKPYTYTLSLSLPKSIGHIWIKKFTQRLLYLQKKYNFFLNGGDIGSSNNIYISANFFGYVKKNSIIKRSNARINDSIWVTGNIGDSYIGLLLKKNKLNINDKMKKYYFNKYHFPLTNMLGQHIYNFVNSAIDISDGFLGDLSKLLDGRLVAEIIFNNIPLSKNSKILLNDNLLDSNLLLNAGDDYELIFTSSNKHDSEIINIAKMNKCKISKVGRIIDTKGLFIDGKKITNCKQSFQYLF